MRVLAENRVIRAMVFTFACHCTSITNGNEGFYEIHPDWAIACAMLEEKYPGSTVLFLTGAGRTSTRPCAAQ